MFGLQYVGCINMFGLQYVAMYQYARITVCGDVSVCSDYSMWRCISMFGLQYVAMYQYVSLVRRGSRSIYSVITSGNVSVCQNYVSGEVSVRPVTTSLTIIQIKTLSLCSLL